MMTLKSKHDLNMHKDTTACCWIAQREVYFMEISTVPGIVPGPCGSRTRRPSSRAASVTKPDQTHLRSTYWAPGSTPLVKSGIALKNPHVLHRLSSC